MSDAGSVNDFSADIIEEFRANDGVVGGPFAGAPMVLLTTTGAKSGRSHTTPLVTLTEGDDVYVFGSKGGAPTHPAWYHNLFANPRVVVEQGTESFEADAEVVTGDEHDEVYARQAARFPHFTQYQQNTTRTIPVVRLRRVS